MGFGRPFWERTLLFSAAATFACAGGVALEPAGNEVESGGNGVGAQGGRNSGGTSGGFTSGGTGGATGGTGGPNTGGVGGDEPSDAGVNGGRGGGDEPRDAGAIGGSSGTAGETMIGAGGEEAGEAGAPNCGNSMLDDGEACDDGNVSPGDGCSRKCRPEPVALSLGHVFSCALSSIGTVKCWGMNRHAELGIGDSDARGDEPGEMGTALPAVDLGTGRFAVQLVAGFAHVCVLLDDASVKCWGENQFGQVGEGNTADRGNRAGEMGDALPVVDLGTNRSALALAAGINHTCAILDDGSVKCWGEGLRDALGTGDDENRGDEPGEMGDALPRVDLGVDRTAKAITAGRHTCATLDDDSIRCWGDDAVSVTSLGASTPVALVASNDTAALFADGSLKCWGPSYFGSAGIGTVEFVGDRSGVDLDTLIPAEVGPISRIGAGWAFKCALLETGSVKCWGVNEAGQLGLGDTQDRGDEPGEMGDALPEVDLGSGPGVRFLAGGSRHACAIFEDASVKCWGAGYDGATGYGTRRNRGDEPGEMGDELPAVDLVF